MAYKSKKSYGTKSVHRATITYGIKVSEISRDVTEQQLRHCFAGFGPISSIFLKQSSPFNHAFINYQILADAMAATAAMNGARIGHNALKVKLQDDDHSISQPVQSEKYTLKISNLNPMTTKKKLSMLFQTDVTIIKVSGKPSYAYANYDHEINVKDGLKFHDMLLDDFNIQVKLSRSSVDHSTLSQSSDSSCAPQLFSVKISNIHPTTTQERLSELFKTTVIVNTVPGGPNYGYANYDSEIGVNFALNFHNFVVDDYKIQVKPKSKSRPLQIQKSPMQKNTKVVYKWKYKNNKDELNLYTEEQSQAIETMWQSKTPSTIQIGRWTYAFDFGTMEQINLSTKRRRLIRRDCQVVDDSDLVTKYGDLSLSEPSKESVIAIQSRQRRSSESSMISEEIPLTTTLPYAKISEISTKHDVKVHELTSNKVVFIGLENKVLKATVEIKDIMLKYSKCESISYPDEWESQDENLELKVVNSSSSEWYKVSQLFNATLSSKQIVKIERIQNKWLWEKYYQHSERMLRKNEGMANEMLLFHGTRNNKPSDIYEHEEGFDLRFGRAGMWGNGNYFAVNASYSNSYAYHLPDGTRQMLLAKVLTGYSTELASDSTLRMPPIRTKETIRYDTVTGRTNGSQVYIAYSNDKAYPFYLISYK